MSLFEFAVGFAVGFVVAVVTGAAAYAFDRLAGCWYARDRRDIHAAKRAAKKVRSLPLPGAGDHTTGAYGS